MTTSEIRAKLIESGVKNLHVYGYPHCTADNILTDEIYSAFFAGMLRDNRGIRQDVDIAIGALLQEIRP